MVTNCNSRLRTRQWCKCTIRLGSRGAKQAGEVLGTSAAFYFLAYTDARRGDACGLMWTDVDLDAGVARIQRAAVRVKGQGIVVQPPKTKRGRRAIALDPDTIDVLRAHRGAQLVRQMELGDSLSRDDGFVFPNQTGRVLDPFSLTDTWRRLVARAGLPKVRLYDLRHFHASVLLQANTNPKDRPRTPGSCHDRGDNGYLQPLDTFTPTRRSSGLREGDAGLRI